MILDRAVQQEKLISLFGAMHKAQVKEVESSAELERKMNRMLDSILSIKENLRKEASEISVFFPEFSELMWFDNVEGDLLDTIGRIIAIMQRMATKMVRHYAKINTTFTKNGIDRTELREYKEAADTLKEMAVDMHNRFFVFPQDKDMQDIAQMFAEF